MTPDTDPKAEAFFQLGPPPPSSPSLPASMSEEDREAVRRELEGLADRERDLVEWEARLITDDSLTPEQFQRMQAELAAERAELAALRIRVQAKIANG